MYRIILFLLLVALAASGAAWIADQPGEIAFPWNGGLAHVTLLEFAVGFGTAVVAAMIAWTALRGCGGCRKKSERPTASGVMRAAGTRSRKGCLRSVTAI